MFVLRKLSLSLSAAAVVGGYSLAHAVIKRIRTKNQAPALNTSDSGWPLLPLEIQELILNEALLILNNKELLELTLTCKSFYTYISFSNTWTNRQSPTFGPKISLMDEACRNTGFPPKINYFFKQKRLVQLQLGGSAVRRRRDTGFATYGYHAKDLYVPWLINDFFTQPATFWKFVRTIIVDPESLFKFLVQEDIFSSRAAIHRPTVKRIGAHLKILTIVLCILPWIDLFIAKSPMISAVTSATSLQNFFELIWNFDPMPIPNMIHTSMPLFFSLLLDNVFYFSDLLPYQAVLALIMLLFNRGLKTALILALTAVMPVVLYLASFKFLNKLSGTKYWWTPLILIVGSLLFFDPIISIYLLFGTFTVVWDMAQRALRPKQFKMRFARWFLLGSALSALSAIVVVLLK